MALVLNPAVQIIEVGRRLYERGLVAGSEGNMSIRLGDDRIMVTPAGFCKGRMKSDDLVVVDGQGQHLQGLVSASTELPMHLRIYEKRPEINACVHSHAPYATSFAVAARELPGDILPEIVVLVGGIQLTQYAPPGTDLVGESLEPFLEENNAFLLKNHGLLTIGTDLDEAFMRHEMVEQYARIVHLARQLGDIDAIPQDDFKRLEQMRLGRKENDSGGNTES